MKHWPVNNKGKIYDSSKNLGTKTRIQGVALTVLARRAVSAARPPTDSAHCGFKLL